MVLIELFSKGVFLSMKGFWYLIMNLISFSLYGNQELYIKGAIRNSEFIQKNLVDWQAIFFVSSDTSAEVISQLQSNGAMVEVQSPDWHSNGMFWRFFAFDYSDFDYIAIRDTDSRISSRELYCIQEWVKSGKSAHIIRDHPLHNSLIMGGMWGCRSKLLCGASVWRHMADYGVSKGDDQLFLNQHIYPVIVKDALVHDSYFTLENFSKRISPSRLYGEFIGEVYNEHDLPNNVSREFLLEFERHRFKAACIRFMSRFYILDK